jgi:hypothetical protein
VYFEWNNRKVFCREWCVTCWIFIVILVASPESQAFDEERKKELIDEIITDIPNNEDDYLDLSLDDEAALLNEYQARISSLE